MASVLVPQPFPQSFKNVEKMCREKGLAQKKTEAKKIVFSSQKCPQIHLEIPCIRFLQGMILHASSSSNTIPERMENSELVKC